MSGRDGALRDVRNWRYLVNPCEPSWGEPFASIADPHAGTRWTTPGHATDGGDVVIVSHQLPIWMVHRRVAGKSARATTRAGVAARCRASPRSSARRRAVRRGRLSRARARAPPVPSTWGRCDARLALASPRSRVAPRSPRLRPAARRLHERPARRPVPRGQRQELHRRRRHRSRSSPSRSAASRSSSRATTDDGRRRLERRLRSARCIVVNFWYAACAPVPGRGADLEDVVAAVRRRGRRASSASTCATRRGTAAAFAETYGVTYPSILDVETAPRQLAFAGHGARRRRADHARARPARAGSPRASSASSPTPSILESIIDDAARRAGLRGDASHRRDRRQRRSCWLALPIALLAGLVSFLSPCVLPLVPGYLGYIGGFTDASAEARGTRNRRRLLLGVLLFIAGFTRRVRGVQHPRRHGRARSSSRTPT